MPVATGGQNRLQTPARRVGHEPAGPLLSGPALRLRAAVASGSQAPATVRGG